MGRDWGEANGRHHWYPAQFEAQLTNHLLKSNDFTAVDLTDYAAFQHSQVRDMINRLTAAQRSTIGTVGFDA